MNRIKLLFLITLLLPYLSFGTSRGKTSASQKNKGTEWFPGQMLQTPGKDIKLVGKPELVACQYGQAVAFNGISDGIFLDQMPLAGLKKFTIEILLCPAKGGKFEQRYFHCGEVNGSRVMLELRSTDTTWYLDAFFKSGDQSKPLIEPTLTHPLDQWAHVAYVIDHHRQQTFVNGRKELESNLGFQPFEGGKTSLGVRQNELSWFKGAIYRIRITPKTLKPKQFFKY